jgi:tetratricopeptide (TPR) repeat protein
MALGTEQYSTGDLSSAINYLSSALEGEYCSEMAKPSSLAMTHFENAQIYSMLSVIYREQGLSERAKEEYAKSQALFKKVKQETPSQDLLKRWENMSQMALNHFKRDLQQAPSPNK